VKVIAQPVRRNDEKYLVPLAVALIDTPVPYLHTARFQITSYRFNVRHQDGRAVLSGIAAIDGESDPGAIAFENDGWHGLIEALDFAHAKVICVPLRCPIDVDYR
jgi:hypothetical protein